MADAKFWLQKLVVDCDINIQKWPTYKEQKRVPYKEQMFLIAEHKNARFSRNQAIFHRWMTIFRRKLINFRRKLSILDEIRPNNSQNCIKHTKFNSKIDKNTVKSSNNPLIFGQNLVMFLMFLIFCSLYSLYFVPYK